MDHGLSGGRREDIGRIKEQRDLMRDSPGALIVRTQRGSKWRHWREKRERKQEGEGFSETKQRVVKPGAGKHYKQAKPKTPSAYEQRLVFVSGKVKGIALFGLRSPLFSLQLPFSCMQYNDYFREGKIPFRMEMAIAYISQAVVLLHQPVYKQQHPG